MGTTLNTQTGFALPFTNVQITNAMHELPTPFGQLTAENYFPAEGNGLATMYVEIDLINDVIRALPVTGKGAPTQAKGSTAKSLIFPLQTIKHQDDVLAADIKSMLTIAQRSKNPATFADLFNKRLQKLKNKFNLTWELMRMSALKGVIIDGGGTQLLDLYAAFEITKKIVYFDLSNASADPMTACDLVYQLITQDLGEEVMARVKCKVSRSFFNKLIAHAKVKQYWLNAQQALNMANLVRGNDGGYQPRRLEFGNILFEEYGVAVPMWSGTSTLIIAADKGHAYPDGTLDSHATYYAPPDDIRELDGEPVSPDALIHVTTENMKHGAGVEMLGQMHALPLWRRPKLLVELDAASGTSTIPTGE
jgi:hypothetical protein